MYQWPRPTAVLVSCHSEWHVNCLPFSHPFVSHVPFTFPSYVSWNSYLICNTSQFLCNFHFLMWLLLLMPCPLIGTFIVRDLVYLSQLVDPVKHYLCIQSGTVSLFLSRHWVWLTSMVLLLFQHTFLLTSIWRPITCLRTGCFQSGIFSLRWLKQLFTLGSSNGRPACILLYHSMPALLHLGISNTSGGLGVKCLQPSLDIFRWVTCFFLLH